MGCTTSKLDDLPAIALCRQRCAFLNEAIHERYALSAAHLSYINSLQSIALSLQHFTQVDFTSSQSPSPPPLSHSDSDHQLPSPHQYSYPPPFTYIDHSYPPQGLGSFPAGAYMHLNCMRYNGIPSQVYDQKPISPHAVYLGEYSSSSSFYPSSYPNTNSNPFPYYGGGSSGYYCSPPPYGLEPPVGASSSQPPPRFYWPWDFVRFYDNGDKCYSQHTLSRDSKEIREEEGIPDLEDDDYEYEVVKQVHEDQSEADGGAESAEDSQANLTEALLNQTTPIVSTDNDGVEVGYEAIANANDERYRERDGTRDAFEAASEIEVQFRRASESGTEIARILEVGTLPYYENRGAYQG